MVKPSDPHAARHLYRSVSRRAAAAAAAGDDDDEYAEEDAEADDDEGEVRNDVSHKDLVS